MANVGRGVLLALLLLGPVVVVLDRLDRAGDLTLFALAAAALIPLSWLIGEADGQPRGPQRPGMTRDALRRQRQVYASAERGVAAWPFPAAVVVLGVATVMTALVTETLVGTLRAFAEAAPLSAFFVAVVIVAIVGNATEHGSAVLLARRGRVKLAVEIPLASSAQIAALLIPLIALGTAGHAPRARM